LVSTWPTACPFDASPTAVPTTWGLARRACVWASWAAMARSRPGGRCGGPAASASPAARTPNSTTRETRPTTRVGVFIEDLLSGRSEVASDPVRSVRCEVPERFALPEGMSWPDGSKGNATEAGSQRADRTLPLEGLDAWLPGLERAFTPRS